MSISPEFFTSAIRESSSSAFASTFSNPGNTLDIGDLNSGLIEELSYTLADAKDRAESNAPIGATEYRPGRKLQTILEASEEAPASGSVGSAGPGQVRAPKLSASDQARRAKLVAKANDGIKIYKPFTSKLYPLLIKLSAKNLADVTHAEAKELLEAAGVDHVASAHWGSAVDALLTQLPKAFLKLPMSYALGSMAQAKLAGAMVLPQVSEEAERSMIRVASEPVRSTGRSLLGGAMQSVMKAGFLGRSLPPSANDMIMSADQIRRIEEAIKRIDAPASEDANGERPVDIRPQDLDELRERLTEQLLAHQAQDADRLVALGVSSAQQRAIAIAFANVTVQIVARIGCGAALSAASLGVLTPMIALITYPSMAAVTKGISNWNETNAIARVGIHRYKSSRLDPNTHELKRLEEVSHYLQDHFQHSSEANFHRKLDNVLNVRLCEAQRDIETRDYRIGELELLCSARTSAEHELAERMLKTQREINALDYGFKATKHARNGLQSVPLEYLSADSAAVEALIAQAEDRVACSNAGFVRSLKKSASALLAVHASPHQESADLLARFKLAYERRMHKPISEEQLIEGYEGSRRELKEWLSRHVNPLAGPSNDREFATDNGSSSELTAKRYSYIDANLKLLKARRKLQEKLAEHRQKFDELRTSHPGTQKPDFESKRQEIARKLAATKSKHVAAIAAYRHYQRDVEHFKNGRGDLIDLNGEVAAHVLARSQDIPHQIGQFFAHDLKTTFKRKAKHDYGLSLGMAAVFEAGYAPMKIGSASVTESVLKSSLKPEQLRPIGQPSIEEQILERHPRSSNARDAASVKVQEIDYQPSSDSTEERHRVAADVLRLELTEQTTERTEQANLLVRLKMERDDAEFDWLAAAADDSRNAAALEKTFRALERKVGAATTLLSAQDQSIKQLQALIEGHENAIVTARLNDAKYPSVEFQVNQFGGDAAKISAPAFDALVQSVASLNQEHQPKLLANLIAKVGLLKTTEWFERSRLIWAAFDKLDSFRQVDMVDFMFAGRNANECLTIFEQLLMHAERSDSKSYDARMQWVAYCIQKLDPTNRSLKAQRILQSVGRVLGGDQHATLFQLGMQIDHLESTDRHLFFDEVLSEVKKLPAGSQSGHLLGLSFRLKSLDPAECGQRFSSIADSVGTIAQADRATVIDQLTASFGCIHESGRADAFKSLLESMKHLPAEQRLQARAGAMPLLALLPKQSQLQGYEALMEDTFVNPPLGILGGAFDILIDPKNKMPLVSVGFPYVSPGLTAFEQELLKDEILIDKVPIEREDGTIELCELIHHISAADPQNRLAVFNSLFKRVQKICRDEAKIEPLVSLAAQISYLSESEQTSVFDALVTSAEKFTPLDSVVLWTECLEYLPEKFRARALINALTCAESISERDRGHVLFALSSLFEFIPVQDLPTAFDPFYKAFWHFSNQQMDTYPLINAADNLRFGMRRLAKGDRGKVETMRHQANIESHVKGEQIRAADGTVRSFENPIDWRDEKKNLLKEPPIPYPQPGSKAEGYAEGGPDNEDGLDRGPRSIKGATKAGAKFALKTLGKPDSRSLPSLLDPLTNIDLDKLHDWLAGSSSAGKIADHMRRMRLDRIKTPGQPFGSGFLVRLNMQPPFAAGDPLDQGRFSSADRKAIAQQLAGGGAKGSNKRIAYELITGDKTTRTSTWHVANNLQEVERYCKASGAKLDRVVEVNSKSTIFGQFDVLHGWEYQART